VSCCREGGRSNEERLQADRRNQTYQERRASVFLEIEREVFGGDYGASSWTDQNEAKQFAALLQLTSGKRALEVGAGSGWPSLYLARATGCQVVLADIPREGMRIASERAIADGLQEQCWPVIAEGGHLPLMSGQLDAVYHCDVLC
jgi:protein-L-isoaspartate O-methyltransferase